MVIGNIDSATNVVQEFLQRQGSIHTDGELISQIVFQLSNEVSPTLVVAALEQLSHDGKIELTKTRDKYDSATYIADDDNESKKPAKGTAVSRSKSVHAVSDDEVKRAYDVLYREIGIGGELFIPSCAEFIAKSLTIPRARAHTINGLLAKLGLRESIRLGGGKTRHVLFEYENPPSQEDISIRLEQYRESERARQAAKRDKPSPDQIEIPDVTPTNAPETEAVESSVEHDTQSIDNTQKLSCDLDTEVQRNEPAIVQVSTPLTLAPKGLDGFEAAVMYQLLGLYETTNGADLSQLARRIREVLPVKVRTGVAHLFVEMVRPD